MIALLFAPILSTASHAQYSGSVTLTDAFATITNGPRTSIVIPSVWGGAGSTTATSDYNTGTNWSSGSAPLGSNSAAVFTTTGSTTVNVSAGPITPDSWTFAADAQSFTVNGAAVNFGVAGSGGGIIDNANSGQSIEIINNIGGAGAQVQLLGSSTLVLSGTNSYSGGTLITAGAVQVTNASSVGTGTVTLNGGLFQVQSGIAGVTFSNDFKINNSPFGSAIDANGTTLTIAGNISDDNGHGQLTVQDSFGGGKVVLLGNNTYTGGTTICLCGTLQLGDATHSASLVGPVINEGTFRIFNANTSGITSLNNDGGLTTFFNSTSASAIMINNVFAGRTIFDDASTAGQATIVNTNGGITQFGRAGGSDTSTAGNASIDNSLGGGIFFRAFSNAGTATITNHDGGGINFENHASGASANIINNSGGSTAFLDFSTAGNTNVVTNNGGQLGFFNHSDAGNGIITVNSGGFAEFADNANGSNAQFITNGTGYVDFSQSLGPNGDGRITAGSIAGSGIYYIGGGNTLAVGGNNLSTTVSGVISDNNPCGCTTGSGLLEKDGSGTLTLSGINTYTGTTVVNGGFLDIEGSIASSSLTTVNAGGALTGAGIVGNALIANGGIFVPGNGFGTSMRVQGNLAFQSGALYLVQVSSTTSTFANVTGTVTLAGNVGATLDPGATLVKKQYMILQAAGGVSGTFAGIATTVPGGLVASLSYDPTHAYLNFDLNYGAKNNLNANQQKVASTLANFFNANGGIPAVFASLTPAGLSQASGETGAGIQQATFNAVSMFLNLLTDPFVPGRDGGVTVNSGAQPYAEEDDAMAYAARKSDSARDALARIPTKAEVARDDLFDNRWSVWGSAFGGGANISGNAAVGSNSADVRAFGFAAGADYRISPTTLAGFALGGGGTNFSVASSGSGRSDMVQAGAFVRHSMGASYVTGALAYGGQEVTTDRIVTIAGPDHLRAQFNANSWSGRLEGGYRYATPWVGITPYAAAQFTTIDLPSYAEQVVAGTGTFALSYNAKDVTDSRTELGFRTDKSWAEQNGILTLRGRLAWAHDFNTDRSAAAVFQSLPGTFFVVNGAALAHDSALTTVSLERKWLNGWSAAATFEGEFSDIGNSYAGKAVVRYAW